MLAGSYDIVVEQGQQTRLILTWVDASGNPVNNTPYQSMFTIRKGFDSATAICELTSANNNIIHSGSTGLFTITIGGSITSAFDFNVGVYDFVIWPTASPGQSIRLLEGKVTLARRTSHLSY